MMFDQTTGQGYCLFNILGPVVYSGEDAAMTIKLHFTKIIIEFSILLKGFSHPPNNKNNNCWP